MIAQPQPRPTRYRWLVLVLIFASYMIAGADRANIGVAVPFIKKEFELSNTDVGAMASLFYLGYAAIQIPSGLLFERFGVRVLFTIALAATSASTFFVGLANSALQLKLARVVLGLAEGPLNVGILTTINRWFPTQEKATAVGVFMSSIKVAPAIVPPICAYIIYVAGWREIFYLFAAPGVVIAILWLVCVADDPKASRFCNEEEAAYIVADDARSREGAQGGTSRRAWPLLDGLMLTRVIQPLASNAAILRSWSIWGCAFGYAFLVGIAYAIMTWVPTYLISVKHYAVFQMGFVAATPWVGAIAGNIVGGYLSDRLFDLRRKPVMVLTAASTIFTMYSLIYAPANPVVLALLFMATGVLLNLGYSTFLVYPMGLITKEKVPFATAIVNTMGSLGGAFSPFIVGLILDRYGWDMVFVFLAATSLLTLVLVLSIIEPMTAPRAAEREAIGRVARA